MAKAKIGKRKHRILLRRGLTATKHQFEPISQLRERLMQLFVENQDNERAVTYYTQMIAYLDLIAEQTTEMTEILFELWELVEGDTEAENNDDDE